MAFMDKEDWAALYEIRHVAIDRRALARCFMEDRGWPWGLRWYPPFGSLYELAERNHNKRSLGAYNREARARASIFKELEDKWIDRRPNATNMVGYPARRTDKDAGRFAASGRGR